MKKYIGYYIAGNFYGYSVYEITDALKKKIFVAEPIGKGATRSNVSLDDLKLILERDVLMLNYIERQENIVRKKFVFLKQTTRKR